MGSTLFDEQSKRGNKPMPAPHFSQPGTGVASSGPESPLNPNNGLTGLRVKSGNVTESLDAGIPLGGGGD